MISKFVVVSAGTCRYMIYHTPFTSQFKYVASLHIHSGHQQSLHTNISHSIYLCIHVHARNRMYGRSKRNEVKKLYKNNISSTLKPVYFTKKKMAHHIVS